MIRTNACFLLENVKVYLGHSTSRQLSTHLPIILNIKCARFYPNDENYKEKYYKLKFDFICN